MPSKIIQPKHVLIEQVALSLAATWYDVGRSQGLTSKYKTQKAFAKANLERFIPNAVSILLEMLKSTSNATPEMREEVYEALQERHNDPELMKYRPNIDVNKVIEIVAEMERKKGPVVINTGELDQEEPKTVLHDDPLRKKSIKPFGDNDTLEKNLNTTYNPFKATRH